MQYGAESTVVNELTGRLGRALGMDSVECALSFNAITLTTVKDGRCVTTARGTVHQGINVAVLVQVSQIVLNAENNNKYGAAEVASALSTLDITPYHPLLVVLFVGLSCALFAYLHSYNFLVALVTFVAASLAMATRLLLSRAHFNAFISAIICAFLATLIGVNIKMRGGEADVAIASSVLLLVPSFPIINALSDILKGYINMGVGRFVWASMISLSACVGIVGALVLFGIKTWGLQ